MKEQRIPCELCGYCESCGDLLPIHRLVAYEMITVCLDCIQYAYDSVGYPKTKEKENKE